MQQLVQTGYICRLFWAPTTATTHLGGWGEYTSQTDRERERERMKFQAAWTLFGYNNNMHESKKKEIPRVHENIRQFWPDKIWEDSREPLCGHSEIKSSPLKKKKTIREERTVQFLCQWDQDSLHKRMGHGWNYRPAQLLISREETKDWGNLNPRVQLVSISDTFQGSTMILRQKKTIMNSADQKVRERLHDKEMFLSEE